MKSKQLNCGRCQKPKVSCHCNQPTPSCTTSTKKKSMGVPEYDCTKLYSENECVATSHGFYVSRYDGNDTEPAAGTRLPEPTWYGVFNDCELMQFYASQNKGEQGAQGVQGAQGSNGATGERGVQGAQGQIGAQGAQGVQGDEGFEGAQGAQGINGEQGVDGAQGADGERGVQGSIGAQGGSGIQGAIGAQGRLGNTGAQGAQGVQGAPYQPDLTVETISGHSCPAVGISTILDASTGLVHTCINGTMTGNTFTFGEGVQGAQGNEGAQGTQGVDGAQGAQGAIGVQGRDGAQGQRGVQGERGRDGAQGASGAQGQRGLRGNTGAQGAQGVEGRDGVQGATGAQGVEGQKGDTGAQGSQGVQGAFGGAQGDVGAQGAQGTQGAQGEAGKDYDPNCEPPVVTEIACADEKGNIALVFDDEDVKYMHFADFIPTPYAVANRNTDDEGNVFTVNPNGNIVRWIGTPSTHVIPTNFVAQGIYGDRQQLITFDLNSKSNGFCIGKGEFILKLDCDNCPCTVPVFTRNKNGTVTINDGRGLVFTINPAEASGMCIVSTEPDVTEEPNCQVYEMDGGVALKVSQWKECNEGLPVGSYFYNGLMYINIVEGNTDKPTVGVGKEEPTWVGGFELHDYIMAMINMGIETRFNELKTEMFAILQANGLNIEEVGNA